MPSKAALSITIDLACLNYLESKVAKKSHYINGLIAADMERQQSGTQVSTLWRCCDVRFKEDYVLCPLCGEPAEVV